MTPVEHPSCADPCQIGIARPTRHTPRRPAAQDTLNLECLESRARHLCSWQKPKSRTVGRVSRVPLPVKSRKGGLLTTEKPFASAQPQAQRTRSIMWET